jgi:PHP family Zn ribbon phosphoesterase
MSSFRYGKHSKKRIGVWIKYDKFINSDLYNLIKKDKNKRFYDIVDRIIVTPEYDKKTEEIWIEVWCSNIFNYLNWIDRGEYRSLACTKCITKFDLKFNAKYKTNSK